MAQMVCSTPAKRYFVGASLGFRHMRTRSGAPRAVAIALGACIGMCQIVAAEEQQTVQKFLQQGVSISVPVTAVAQKQPTGETKLMLSADLSDLQTKAKDIFNAYNSSRCLNYGLSNQLDVADAKLTAVQGEGVVLTYAGAARVWNCERNPVPNSRLVFKGFVPQVQTWDSAPIATLVKDEPVKLDYSLTPSKDSSGNWNTARSVIAAPGQNLQAAAVTPRTSAAIQAVGDILNPEKLFGSALSASLRQSASSFDQVHLEDVGGRLTATTTVTVPASQSDLTHLLTSDSGSNAEARKQFDSP